MLIQRIKTNISSLAIYIVLLLVLLLSLTASAGAAEYDCSTYGAGDYNSGGSCASIESSTPGELSNTGQALYIAIPAFLTIAGVFGIFAARQKSVKKHLEQKNENKQISSE